MANIFSRPFANAEVPLPPSIWLVHVFCTSQRVCVCVCGESDKGVSKCVCKKRENEKEWAAMKLTQATRKQEAEEDVGRAALISLCPSNCPISLCLTANSHSNICVCKTQDRESNRPAVHTHTHMRSRESWRSNYKLFSTISGQRKTLSSSTHVWPYIHNSQHLIILNLMAIQKVHFFLFFCHHL